MAQIHNNFWQRNKYKLNGLFLILPFYFLYTMLTPEFPDSLKAQKIGRFEVAPMPYNLDPPYIHEGHYIKDFALTFSEGNIKDIRQAYLNIGNKPLPIATLELSGEGILHGSQHGQEVHAIAPKVFKKEHKIWLTIQDWQGKELTISWDLPQTLL